MSPPELPRKELCCGCDAFRLSFQFRLVMIEFQVLGTCPSLVISVSEFRLLSFVYSSLRISFLSTRLPTHANSLPEVFLAEILKHEYLNLRKSVVFTNPIMSCIRSRCCSLPRRPGSRGKLCEYHGTIATKAGSQSVIRVPRRTWSGTPAQRHRVWLQQIQIST